MSFAELYTHTPVVVPAIGQVIAVRGSKAEIGLSALIRGTDVRITVGSFVVMDAGSTRPIAIVTEIANRPLDTPDNGMPMTTAWVDLVGEIRRAADGSEAFRRGVSNYPSIGDAAKVLSKDQMALIYGASGSRSINIGHLSHDRAMPARIDIDNLIGRHFAILGSTGVGKSSGVTVILREILGARQELRVFLLDCHNEYGRSFGDKAYVVNSRDLKLPFWLFNFEEFVDVLYGGRPPIDEELEVLSELIPIAKSNYLQYGGADRFTIKRVDPKMTGFTVDTPVPYLLQDLIGLLDERMGKLENRASRMIYHRLMSRIDTIRNNPRYDFMFENANVGGDTMADILTQLFRIEIDGKPITIMQLAGLPVEVVDAVVCVLSRLAFEFGMWSDGAVPLLLVCEEAHRYASLDHTVGFAPTRRALARIAKEGRKYGVFLGLVSQRPSELDPNIISQCATLFVMRLSNDRDQALLRSAVCDGTADLMAFVPSLGTREVIAFGEAVPFPTRMMFQLLDSSHLQRDDRLRPNHDGQRPDGQFMQNVVERWRHAVTGRRIRADEPLRPSPAATLEAASLPSATSRLEQARYQLLKR